jgi:acyl-CoA hydrolase
VRIVAEREDPRTGECEHAGASRVVFVAVDDAGDPVPVPDLAVETERDRDRRDAGRRAETGE